MSGPSVDTRDDRIRAYVRHRSLPAPDGLEERIIAAARAQEVHRVRGSAVVGGLGRGRVAPGMALAAVVVLLVLVALTLAPRLGTGSQGGGEAPSATYPTASSSSGSPSPTPSGSLATAAALAPYELSLTAHPASPTPPKTIAEPSDCTGMPSVWLRSFCTLTLRADWRAIVAPTDPYPARPSADTVVESASWQAAMARATIDGDTTICDSVAMKTWLSQPTIAPAGPRLGPVATCLASLREQATKRTLIITDPTMSGTCVCTSVTLTVNPGASARSQAGTVPVFDPAVTCAPPITVDVCQIVADAMTAELEADPTGIDVIEALDPSVAPARAWPSMGQPIGFVLAGGHSSQRAFAVTDDGGRTTVTEVPYDELTATPSP